MIGSTLSAPGAMALALVGIAAVLVFGALVLFRFRDDGRLQDEARRARRWNLVTVGLMVVAAADLLPDLAEETEWTHRLDELAAVTLALAAAAWLLTGTARTVRSTFPLWLAGGFVLAKAAGVLIEIHDLPDVEGDLALVAIGAPIFIALLWRHRADGSEVSRPAAPPR